MNNTAIAIAQLIINLVCIYFIAGLIFAIPFLIFGVQKLDASAKWDWGFWSVFDGIGVRLLILPGSCIFWPLFAIRLWKRKAKPLERNAHRKLAKNN